MKNKYRIHQIKEVKGGKLIAAFNDGYRIVDIQYLLMQEEFEEGMLGFELLVDPERVAEVTLKEGALTWRGLQKTYPLPDGTEFTTYFQLDPQTVFRYSLDASEILGKLGAGDWLKIYRKQTGLTQSAIAAKAGTNKSYISRIEKNHSDIEYNTLRRIMELGIEKEMFIGLYDPTDALRSHSNSILKPQFFKWVEQYRDSFQLILGIESPFEEFLRARGIISLGLLAEADMVDLIVGLSQQFSREELRFSDTWRTQASFSVTDDWIGLIKLQRNLSGGESKVEQMARKAIKDSPFIIRT